MPPQTSMFLHTCIVPPSTRFWYQQWTHCAMTSWCTTSSWLRDLSYWLDQLGQAKPQWPRECCRSWILRHSTYSPSTSLHRYIVYLCDCVCVCACVGVYVGTGSMYTFMTGISLELLTLTTQVISVCKYCIMICKDSSSMHSLMTC